MRRSYHRSRTLPSLLDLPDVEPRQVWAAPRDRHHKAPGRCAIVRLVLSTRIIRLWDRAIHTVARVGYSVPMARAERHGLTLVQDVAYTASGSWSHLLDVYVPKGVTNPPAMLYVHGGGFALLSKETHRIMALALARRGYAVFLCNYRIGPRHRYPAPLEDAAAALLWVADNARS